MLKNDTISLGRPKLLDIIYLNIVGKKLLRISLKGRLSSILLLILYKIILIRGLSEAAALDSYQINSIPPDVIGLLTSPDFPNNSLIMSLLKSNTIFEFPSIFLLSDWAP